jgi:hypothetical protein
MHSHYNSHHTIAAMDHMGASMYSNPATYHPKHGMNHLSMGMNSMGSNDAAGKVAVDGK